MLLSFNPAGLVITDEIVRCDHLVSGLYQGYLAHTLNQSIASNAAYGLWTGAGQTGTKQTVLLTGTPSANEVMIDLLTGIVYAPSQSVFYARYLAHEPLNTSSLTISIPYKLTASNAITLGQWLFPQVVVFRHAQFTVNGSNPSQAATFTLSNGNDSQALTLAATGSCSTTTFTNPFKVSPAETFTISTANGYGAYDLELVLR